MPLSYDQQIAAIKLSLMTFGSAAGTSFSDVYARYVLVDSGTEYSSWDAALRLPQGQNLYSSYLSDHGFAKVLSEQLLGNLVDITHKTWAIGEITQMLKDGWTRGDALRISTDFIINQGSESGIWGAAAQALHNKAMVSYYYTFVQGGDGDPQTLQKIISNVTNITDASSPSAIALVIKHALESTNAQSIALTVDVDNLFGQAGNDIFTAVKNKNMNTLNDVDKLDGRGGRDTLKFVDSSENSLVLSTKLSLSSIEVIDVLHHASAAWQTATLDISSYKSIDEFHYTGTGTKVATTVTLNGGVSQMDVHHTSKLTINDKAQQSALSVLDLTSSNGITQLNASVRDITIIGKDSLDLRFNSKTLHTATLHLNGLENVSIEDNTLTQLSINNMGETLVESHVYVHGPILSNLTLRGEMGIDLETQSQYLTLLDASEASGELNWTSSVLNNRFTGKLGVDGGKVDSSLAKMASVWTGGAGNDYIRVVNQQNNTVHAGKGDNSVFTGSGDDTISVGAGSSVINSGSGNDTISVGAGSSVVNSGPGNDIVRFGLGDHKYIQTVNDNSATFAEITGFNEGDTIQLATTSMNVFNSEKLTGFISLESYLAETMKGETPSVWHFQFGQDTYLVSDNSSEVTFQDGVDQVLKLTGIVELSQAIWDPSIGTLII